MQLTNFLLSYRSLKLSVGIGCALGLTAPALQGEVIESLSGASFNDIRITFDFDDIPAGTQIGNNALGGAGNQPFDSATNSEIPTGLGFDVTVDGGAIATLFESNSVAAGNAASDLDIVGGPSGDLWEGGNLDTDDFPGAPVLGKTLIIQENIGTEDIHSDGLFKIPNDKAGNNNLLLTFETGFTDLAFAWADFDEAEEAAGLSATYGLNTGQFVEVQFTDFNEPTTQQDPFGNDTSDLEFAERTANLFPRVTIADLNDKAVASATHITSLEFDFSPGDDSASGALGFIEGTPIPEPSNFALLLGLASTLFLTRRRERDLVA